MEKVQQVQGDKHIEGFVGEEKNFVMLDLTVKMNKAWGHVLAGLGVGENSGSGFVHNLQPAPWISSVGIVGPSMRQTLKMQGSLETIIMPLWRILHIHTDSHSFSAQTNARKLIPLYITLYKTFQASVGSDLILAN